mmetsp:Transcript_16684/g.25537  ORF Transcript_16684/g.25537 Transcript_16684/m.25537 type:complete len:209 (-) Transcript_16684:101-727(-)
MNNKLPKHLTILTKSYWIQSSVVVVGRCEHNHIFHSVRILSLMQKIEIKVGLERTHVFSTQLKMWPGRSKNHGLNRKNARPEHRISLIPAEAVVKFVARNVGHEHDASAAVGIEDFGHQKMIHPWGCCFVDNALAFGSCRQPKIELASDRITCNQNVAAKVVDAGIEIGCRRKGFCCNLESFAATMIRYLFQRSTLWILSFQQSKTNV